ncbi:beta-mannosyltransferase 1 [Magnolia sinica]|uniref:beta-mannosyltransferase 1 n=1 Tax=Magnolia sinica TaxID=86752 RepID=UPI00265953AC|nr:beta-mannosyltransferase 1 [Magnolia sinica]XP_058070794.1 beta-mannosyltransferase 1 [Magnolia sinica]
MAAAIRAMMRSSSPSRIIQAIRFKNTLSQPHEFSKPTDFLGSWEAPKDPREAEKKLGLLRRDYAKQVKELRRQYWYEMEFQRQEKQLKDEADRESIRRAKEERKAAKAAMARTRAAERKVFEDEFRETLLKERREKLENWKAKEEMREHKKSEKKELLRRQSSMWIDEEDVEKKILEAVVDMTAL